MASTYPDFPGFAPGSETSRAAAEAIASSLGARQAEVLEAIANFGVAGATCDMVASIIELPVHVVRPRASELERKGKLFPVGKRMGMLGHLVTVYSAFRPVRAGGAA